MSPKGESSDGPGRLGCAAVSPPLRVEAMLTTAGKTFSARSAKVRGTARSWAVAGENARKAVNTSEPAAATARRKGREGTDGTARNVGEIADMGFSFKMGGRRVPRRSTPSTNEPPLRRRQGLPRQILPF